MGGHMTPRDETTTAAPDKPVRTELDRGFHYTGRCYCGLGPRCQYWEHMTPAERERCSLDKRSTQQWYYQNGM